MSKKGFKKEMNFLHEQEIEPPGQGGLSNETHTRIWNLEICPTICI